MNQEVIIDKLKSEYPNANIVVNNPENPTEIVCEVDPEKGLAVAVIDRSEPHHHLQIEEKYIVKKGVLTLYIDGSEKELSEGDDFVIYPGEVHFVLGDETWVEVTSTPPWSPDDHILEKELS